jgi:hypothetical protein
MNEYKYICNTCNFKTNSLATYEIHENTGKHKLGGIRKTRRDKKPENEIKCNYCDYKNQNIGNLRKHTLNNHCTNEEREKEFKYYCKVCNYGSFGITEYNNHIKSKRHIENKENT